MSCYRFRQNVVKLSHLISSPAQNFNEEERALANQNEYNFDHPDAFDYDLLIETLQNLKKGKSVEVPIYSFKFHRREKQKVGYMS